MAAYLVEVSKHQGHSISPLLGDLHSHHPHLGTPSQVYLHPTYQRMKTLEQTPQERKRQGERSHLERSQTRLSRLRTHLAKRLSDSRSRTLPTLHFLSARRRHRLLESSIIIIIKHLQIHSPLVRRGPLRPAQEWTLDQLLHKTRYQAISSAVLVSQQHRLLLPALSVLGLRLRKTNL